MASTLLLDAPLSLVERIHAASTRIVVALTGGGSGAISALLEVPGASRTVLEAMVPYAAPALADWLGASPEHYCSSPTARAMAMVAYQRAVWHASSESETGTKLAGIGCTASLASDRPKRGPHRLHVAVQTGDATTSYTLELHKGERSRHDEEQVATRLVLNAIAEAAGIYDRLDLHLLPGEAVESSRFNAPVAWQELLVGQVDAVAVGRSPDRPFDRRPRILFPGAFNPRHDGHRRMAEIAARRLSLPIEHEIATINVDKPPLDFIVMHERAGQFSPDETLWFTRSDTFVKKALIFPGTTFVVGVDTVVRIADPRYYGGDPGDCHKALDQIAAQGCRFLVFGRKTADGFHTSSNIELPEVLAQICDEVPEAEFREDISSTEVRTRL